MAAQKRKKKRTHVKPVTTEGKAVGSITPKSFVIRSGKVTRSVQQLVRDCRRIMEPNTASRLKERNKNKLKDFVAMAGPLGVSHFMIFSQTDSGTNLKICKSPHGPTATLRIKNFTLAKDLVKSGMNGRTPGTEYQTAPLLVLNNTAGNSSGGRPDKKFELLSTMLQNMFPALNIQKLHISECRRVVVFDYDPDQDLISMRHYYIYVRPVGISKGIKVISSATGSHIPDLSKYSDISEFIDKNDFVSESEVEDNGQSTVTLSQSYVGRGNRQGRKSADEPKRAIKLVEIGPRIDMQLLKIEAGLCEGEVLYHKYVEKTVEEVEQLGREKQKKLMEKERRKREQEANVERKKGDNESTNVVSFEDEAVEDGDEESDDDFKDL